MVDTLQIIFTFEAHVNSIERATFVYIRNSRRQIAVPVRDTTHTQHIDRVDRSTHTHFCLRAAALTKTLNKINPRLLFQFSLTAVVVNETWNSHIAARLT